MLFTLSLPLPMATSLILTCIFAMFLYALSRGAWLAIFFPTFIALAWLANDMGAFRPGQGEAMGNFIGISPVFLLVYGLAGGAGVAIVKALATVVDRRNRR